MSKNQGERLLEFRSLKGLTQRELAQEIGVERPHLSQMESGARSISGRIFKLLAQCYPDLDMNWLIRGFELPSSIVTNHYLVPVAAQASYIGEWTQEWIDQHLKPILIPGLTGDLRTFEVSGDSMVPTLIPGDYVSGRRVFESQEIKEKEIHVVVSKSSGIYVKRLVIGHSDLILYSDNQKYPPIGIDMDDVHELYICQLKLSKELAANMAVEMST